MAKTAIVKEPIVNIKRGNVGQHGSCPCRGSASIGIARKFDASGEGLGVNFRNGFYPGMAVAAAWGVYVWFLWQPERQVDLHNLHLLEQIEKHDWKAVGEFIGADYQDRWGNDRARLLERLREVFRVLPNAKITANTRLIRIEERRGYWTAKVTIKSSGEYADYIEGRVNTLGAPFEFEWKRGGWPWNWTLVAVRNPELEIPGN